LPISVAHVCKVGLGFKSPYTGARYHQRNHWQHDPSRPTQVHSRKVPSRVPGEDTNSGLRLLLPHPSGSQLAVSGLEVGNSWSLTLKQSSRSGGARKREPIA
jgi:hypothetical protein